jgi:hypothetical protein
MFVLDSYSKMVFRKDNEFGTFYQIGLSKKDRNGNYINGYMNVRFKKGVSAPNMTKIVIKNAFIDFYLDKNNRTVPYIMILEYELAEEEKKETKEEALDPFATFGQTVTANDIENDLPF